MKEYGKPGTGMHTRNVTEAVPAFVIDTWDAFIDISKPMTLDGLFQIVAELHNAGAPSDAQVWVSPERVTATKRTPLYP